MAKVRTTLNLDEEVLSAWQDIARREGSSLSACVNEWLRQVEPAAGAVASVIDEDRQASKARLSHIITAVQAANEIYLNAVEVARVSHPSQAKKAGGGGRVGDARGGRPAAALPPSSNTGGKPTKGGGAR